MDSANKESLRKMLIRHEGFKSKPYTDSRGIPTLGVGRNLSCGLSDDEIMLMLNNDINRTTAFLAETYCWFESLNAPRQMALIDMAFNLGCKGFSGFKNMIKYIERQEWDRASNEILDSLYANQVGDRAKEIAEILRTGEI